MYKLFLYCPGTPGRESNFEDRARNFQAHAQRLADTANSVATAGGCRNKATVEAIFKNSNQVRHLSFASCFVVLLIVVVIMCGSIIIIFFVIVIVVVILVIVVFIIII
jgi:Flp pilus assembly protein TadB